MRTPFFVFAFIVACDVHPTAGEYAVTGVALIEDTCGAFSPTFEAAAFTDAGLWVSDGPDPGRFVFALDDPPVARWECEVVGRRLRCGPRGTSSYAPDYRLEVAYFLGGRFRENSALDFEYRVRTQCEGSVCAPAGLGPDCEARVTGIATPAE